MKNTIKSIIYFSIINILITCNIQAHTHYTSEIDLAFMEKNQCEDKVSYGYFTMGTGPVILIPNLGVGYRSRIKHHGFDASLNASTIIIAHSVQGSLLYHFYPDYQRQDPWYVGAGVSAGLFFDNTRDSCFGISPDIVVGKELYSHRNTKHFFEAHVQTPTWFGNSLKRINRLDFPMVYIKYGLAF